MLRFLFFAVVAYVLYQFIMSVNWSGAMSSTENKVSNGANGAVQDVTNSSLAHDVEDVLDSIKKLIFP